MSDPVAKPSPPKPRPRRPWSRCFLQFSLRTLLLLTTLAAFACWWYLRPHSRDELLAGKYLQLHREFHLEKIDPNNPPFSSANVQVIGGDRFLLVNAGRWQLRDENKDLLVAGRYANDQPHGKWTIYHTSGQKAAEGEAFRGARRGLWRTWDAEGRLQSEVTYAAREQPFIFNKPVTSVTSDFLSRLPLKTLRHGPARAYHPTGRLQSEGHYQDDLRHGPWTFHDQEGHITSRIEYENGKSKSHTEALRHRAEENN